jgi:membrane-associated phospholipid phosphatase
MNVDVAIEQALYAVRTPDGVAVFSFFTDFGGAAMVIVVMAAALFLFYRGAYRHYALGLLVSVAGSALAALCIKLLVERPRPPLYLHAVVETSSSFPSSHATAAAALYGFLAVAAYPCGTRVRCSPHFAACSSLPWDSAGSTSVCTM